MAHTKEEIKVIKEFIEKHPDANIVLGVDSQRMKKKRVKFATVVIIHYRDSEGIGKGAKVFSDVIYESVKDSDLSKPYNRMMYEVNLVNELYAELEDVLILRDFEIHIDVNPVEGTGSNVAYNSAKWTVFGMTGVEPICKPHAWGASACADRYSK
jgi:predicted RNase H-related nuclease YkuK (DUF458 family)